MNAPALGTDGASLQVTFASDINPLLAEAFLEEAPVHAARFAETVGRLAGSGASIDDVVQAQRVAHTLKGSAHITGVDAIAELTHQAEDVLDWLSENRALPPAELGEVLVETADCVAAMVDALRDGGTAPASTVDVLARLKAWCECRRDVGDAAGDEAGVDEAAAADAPCVDGDLEHDPEDEPVPDLDLDLENEPQADPVSTWGGVEDDDATGATCAADGTGTAAPPSALTAVPAAGRRATENDALSDGTCPAPETDRPVTHAREQILGATASEAKESHRYTQAPDVPAISPATASPVSAQPREPAGAGPDPTGAPEPARAAASAPAAPAPPRPAAATLRVPVDLVDQLLRLAGEFAVSNVQSQGAHQRMTAQTNSLREQYHLVQQRLSDLQDLVEIRGVPSRNRRGGGGTTTDTGTLVDDDFDPLELDEYNELHSKSTALAEAMTDFCEVALGLRPELARLDDTIADQQRISKELSDAVMSARMVPVGSVAARLERAVRETCRVTGKQAVLEIEGGELPVDGDVLNALVDPLLHVLRNAVDHGIEGTEERARRGKPATGALQLRFSREGDNVRVSIRDDGRGFDVDRIREVAEARGVLSAGEARTERELMQLAVLSGFSTRDQATRVSGRGIGMDVVHKAVLDLKGSMDIVSEPGAGACINLRVPLTLISMHVLLVRAAGRVYGVPSGSLEQVLFSDAGSLEQEGEETTFRIDERAYRVRHLGELTGRAPDPNAPQPKVLPLLLLDADAGPTAVIVDAAVDGRYLVVKSLGQRVPRPGGVIGASILGDGSVAPVLDLRELLRRRSATAAAAAPGAERQEAPEEAIAPEVLVVDDSLTARRMLSIALGDAGYRVRTAIDGLDAVEAMEDGMPDMVITDLEMPRMNGLEFAAHLRSEDDTRELPVLMVTSRSTDKHRGQAEAAGINDFITKPYANDELLERVERLLDIAAAAA